MVGIGRRRRLFCAVGQLVVVVSGVSVASPAAAEPWWEAHAEVGLVSGHYEFEKGYRTAAGDEAVAHDEGGPLGVAMGVGAVAGLSVDSKLAVGLAPRIELAPYFEPFRPRYTSVSSHFLIGVGPVLAFRPEPSFELRVSPEWMWASTHGSRMEIAADDNVFEHEPLTGPGAAFSLAYVSAPGWVFGLTGRAGLLSGEHSTFAPVGFSFFAGWSSL